MKLNWTAVFTIVDDTEEKDTSNSMYTGRSTMLNLFVVAAFLCWTANGFIAPPNKCQGNCSPFSKHLGSEKSSTDSIITQPSLFDKQTQGVVKPGSAENLLFKCDESVAFWRAFDSQGNDGNLRRMWEILSAKFVNGSTKSRAYWSSQVLRTGYFTFNAALGSMASDIHERFIGGRNKNSEPAESVSVHTSPVLSAQNGGMSSRILNSEIPTRLLLEASKTFEQDWEAVDKGLIKFPWDAIVQSKGESVNLQWDHQQANPFFVASATGRTILESIGTLSRRYKLMGKPSEIWVNKNDDPIGATGLYPSYYLNDFHYQTDGWFSTESANRYETLTETLFLGRQDAMQRQTLIPLKNHFVEKVPKNILEIACGTGRLATFTRDNYPTTDIMLTDLSPFYLEKARKNDEYWRSYRGKAAMKEVGLSGEPRPASFLQANCESLPIPDNSFDAVICVYLFHELPSEARARAATEMVRIVRPGGIVVLTDSVQLGDRPPMDSSLTAFSNLNEPYYENYVKCNLPELFQGLECSEKFVSSSTKTLSFKKPIE